MGNFITNAMVWKWATEYDGSGEGWTNVATAVINSGGIRDSIEQGKLFNDTKFSACFLCAEALTNWEKKRRNIILFPLLIHIKNTWLISLKMHEGKGVPIALETLQCFAFERTQ